MQVPMLNQKEQTKNNYHKRTIKSYPQVIHSCLISNTILWQTFLYNLYKFTNKSLQPLQPLQLLAHGSGVAGHGHLGHAQGSALRIAQIEGEQNKKLIADLKQRENDSTFAGPGPAKKQRTIRKDDQL